MKESSREDIKDRRPLKTRNQQWAQNFASRVAATGLSPNAISTLGIVMAIGAAVCLIAQKYAADWGEIESGWHWSQSLLLVAAALFIQLRLLCNMLDGMVAVEGGRQSPLGLLYNEVPDRFEDIIILAGAGYGATNVVLPEIVQVAALISPPELGWICTVGAVLTAYVRVQGQYTGTSAMFHGPMAKPHRMFTLTLGCILAAVAAVWEQGGDVLHLTLWVILVGTAVTIARRLILISRELRGSAS